MGAGPAVPAPRAADPAAGFPPGLPDTIVLELGTGKVIAGDPATLYADAHPLPTVLPRGSFPVRWTPGLIRVEFAAVPPTEWAHHPGFRTASGYGCLLDADALAEFTDLGDEPVDEYELLAERFGPAGPGAARPGLVAFGGLIAFAAPRGVGAVRIGSAGPRTVRLDCEIIT